MKSTTIPEFYQGTRGLASRAAFPTAVQLIAIMATLIVLLGGPVSAQTQAWPSSLHGEAKPANGLLRQDCSDPKTAQSRVHEFTVGLRDLAIHMDGLPGHVRAIAIEAVDLMETELAIAEKELCQLLESPAGKRVQLDELRRTFRERGLPGGGGSVPGCMSIEAYQALVGLKSILEIGAQISQAICDGASCPEPFTPLSCFYSCVATGPILAITSVFQLRMDRADKCADLEHEIEMAGMRDASTLTIFNAASSASNASNVARNTTTDSASESDLSRASQDVLVGFDGGTRFDQVGRFAKDGSDGRAPDAIGPGLESLSAVVAAQQAEQAIFEREAVLARLEAALASGVVYSRMQRPRRFGGLLDQVRELVALRIQATQSAGGDTVAALAAFRSADQAFNLADYRGALAGYRQAYVELGAAASGSNDKGE